MSNMSKKGEILRWFLIGGGILFICFSFYAYQIFFADNIQVDKEDTYVYIRTGATFPEVLDTLEKRGIVHDRLSFAFVSQLMKYQDRVKPGRYKLKKNSSNIEAVRKLRSGDQEAINFTFTNIRKKEQLIEIAGEKFEMKAEDLSALLNDPEFLKPYGFTPETVMSMFIPNTYQLFWTTSAKGFFERMNKEYKKFWTAERLKKAKEEGLSPIQVSILASIVQEETNANDEKARVAGVYINRLHSGMKLQADPTVKFALDSFEMRRILIVHTQTDSPYNTYMYEGLPPGPISLPSIVTLDAVLNYEHHKYLFFVADMTKPGYHIFKENYRDHVNTANKYRKNLNGRGL